MIASGGQVSHHKLSTRHHVQVGVLAASLSAAEVWERRVGGVLKGLGVVRHKFLFEKNLVSQIRRIDEMDDCDMLVCYGGGEFAAKLSNSQILSRKILEAELNILPIGIKMLHSLPNGARVGVVMRHLRCANLLLDEILKAGIVNKRFTTGTIDEIPRMAVDFILVAEEMAEEVVRPLQITGEGPQVVNLPRNLAFSAIGSMITRANKLLEC